MHDGKQLSSLNMTAAISGPGGQIAFLPTVLGSQHHFCQTSLYFPFGESYNFLRCLEDGGFQLFPHCFWRGIWEIAAMLKFCKKTSLEVSFYLWMMEHGKV